MKLNYYKNTDSLYISLTEKESVDSQEIRDGIVLDFDEYGLLVGIDIDNASKSINLSNLEANSLPLENISLK